ncbi:hypothetical protein U9M48_042197 [Paspalum notatum var. saurae]|uniref:Reverse transcriptase zinc-binding domain-containing protein n=1 Tax=Paspalum notatum var. saurae TaxID=547442 RepID=A0AAQ3XFQ4_PASNO
MVEKVASKLPVCHGPLMSRSGRLVWIKSVLMAMPVFAMMANSLPAWVKAEVDAICRKFLWAGSDQSVRGRSLVAWPMVARPLELGGLGVPDLKLYSIALQTRWLWLQRTDEHRVWSDLPIKVAAEVRAFFDASIRVEIGNGRRTLFWRDRWVSGLVLADIAPALTAAIPRRTAKSLTMAEGLNNRRWIRGIVGGLTVTVIAEYLRVWQRLEGLHLREDVEDRVIWRWSGSGQYCARSAYRALYLGFVPFLGSELIWRSWMPLRVKIFIWLAFRRRHWTANRHRRHGLDARELCWLCDQEPETCDHLLFRCQFARAVWARVLDKVGLHLPRVAGCSGLLDWWRRFRGCWPATVRKGADTLFGLVCWSLWKQRNACCFRGEQASTAAVLKAIYEAAELWVLGGAAGLGTLGLI